MSDKTLRIFTDGSCAINPGRGGWSFLAFDTLGTVSVGCGCEESTTNNQMEIRAAISALEYVLTKEEKGLEVEVSTDSQYVARGITSWIENWKGNNWQTSQKTPVKNKELWQLLDDLNKKVLPKWKWVKAHDVNPYNNLVDRLAQHLTKNGDRSTTHDISKIVRLYIPIDHVPPSSGIDSISLSIKIAEDYLEERFNVCNRFGGGSTSGEEASILP